MPFDESNEATPPETPEWVKRINAAREEGSSVIDGVLAERPQHCTVFWVSVIDGLEFGRDPIEGNVLLRLSGKALFLPAVELSVLAGMLMEAAMIQGAVEAQPDDGDQF